MHPSHAHDVFRLSYLPRWAADACEHTSPDSLKNPATFRVVDWIETSWNADGIILNPHLHWWIQHEMRHMKFLFVAVCPGPLFIDGKRVKYYGTGCFCPPCWRSRLPLWFMRNITNFVKHCWWLILNYSCLLVNSANVWELLSLCPFVPVMCLFAQSGDARSGWPTKDWC